MFKENKNLLIIALVAVVNALGYGIIIPILYSYSLKFGLSDFQNGLLFALFSLCQFISTPIIGRLSDKFGRKPLLIISIAGTAVSFLTMAFAPNALFLFIGRALDGLTAGNIPVASAVISDTTAPKDRAKGFGIIGASFGFGFIFGPAISGLTAGFGLHVPFLIAAGVSIVAVVLTALFLPETNKHMGQLKQGKLFDLGKLVHALFNADVGFTLLITFLYSFAFALFMYAYQPNAVKSLHLSPQQISAAFTVFGVVGLLAQMLVIPRVIKIWGEYRALVGSLVILSLSFFGFYFANSFLTLVLISIILALVNAFVNPLVQTFLSKEVDAASQGEIQGINASYMSIGMIIGPVVGGIAATVSIPFPFILGGVMIAGCAGLAIQIHKQQLKKVQL